MGGTRVISRSFKDWPTDLRMACTCFIFMNSHKFCTYIFIPNEYQSNWYKVLSMCKLQCRNVNNEDLHFYIMEGASIVGVTPKVHVQGYCSTQGPLWFVLAQSLQVPWLIITNLKSKYKKCWTQLIYCKHFNKLLQQTFGHIFGSWNFNKNAHYKSWSLFGQSQSHSPYVEQLFIDVNPNSIIRPNQSKVSQFNTMKFSKSPKLFNNP